MQITNIRESGSNNTLLWAIENGADIKDDMQLCSIINDDLFYLFTLKGVNFFEVFRLSQMYREKLRIVNECEAEVPSNKELQFVFPGDYISDKETPDKKIPLYETAEHCISTFFNMVLQMMNDDDIISPSALRLFLPMISRKFDVQIPVSFIDFVESMNEDEAKEMFTREYPNTINKVLENESHGVNHIMQLGFLKATSIIKYPKRYDQYLDIVKYSPLKTCKNNELYKFGLLGFHKYDNISHGEIRCNLFNPDKENLSKLFKRISNTNTPLYVDFAIKLPIQYMHILANSFSREELPMMYESSMSTMINNGMLLNTFIMPEYDENEMTEEVTAKVESIKNQIEAYRTRITEANQITLNTITVLLNSENDIDTTSAFALLPSLYMAQAVITVKVDDAKKYLGISDTLLSNMFVDIFNTVKRVIEDINSVK